VSSVIIVNNDVLIGSILRLILAEVGQDVFSITGEKAVDYALQLQAF